MASPRCAHENVTPCLCPLALSIAPSRAKRSGFHVLLKELGSRAATRRASALSIVARTTRKRNKPMGNMHGFALTSERDIPEISSLARLYRHKKTGAELVSLLNEDENKVFGINFVTVPADSSGVAHILEHSVLGGSRKFRVKEPFLQMMKGSLHTYLNAITFPDKT